VIIYVIWKFDKVIRIKCTSNYKFKYKISIDKEIFPTDFFRTVVMCAESAYSVIDGGETATIPSILPIFEETLLEVIELVAFC